MINDMEYYINTVKTPNTVLAGGKLNCTVLVGGGGGARYLGRSVFFIIKTGESMVVRYSGDTIFEKASIGGFTKTGESMVHTVLIPVMFILQHF